MYFLDRATRVAVFLDGDQGVGVVDGIWGTVGYSLISGFLPKNSQPFAVEIKHVSPHRTFKKCRLRLGSEWYMGIDKLLRANIICSRPGWIFRMVRSYHLLRESHAS